MSDRYEVIFKGEILQGHNLAEVKKRLIYMLNIPPSKIDLLFSGREVRLKKNLSQTEAKAFADSLIQAGADFAVVDAVTGTPIPEMQKQTLAVEEQPENELEAESADSELDRSVSEATPFDQTDSQTETQLEDSIVEPQEPKKQYEPPKPSFAQDLKPFVTVNKAKYLPRFEKFYTDKPGFKLTWHWPAFLCPTIWSLYRSLYLLALISFLITIVPVATLLLYFDLIPQQWLAGFSLPIPWIVPVVMGAVWVIFRLFCATSAYYIYFKKAKRIIDAMRGKSPDGDIKSALIESGGTNSWAPGLAIIIFLALVALVAVPEYLTYMNNMVIQKFPKNAILRPTYTMATGTKQAGTACLIKSKASSTPLLITAQHIFSQAGGFDRTYTWEEMPDIITRIKADCIADNLFSVTTTKVVSLKGTHGFNKITSNYDLAIFPLENSETNGIPVLKLALFLPKVDDPVWLFAKVKNDDSLFHRATIVKASDQEIIFSYNNDKLDLTETSGAPLLDKQGQIVALSIDFSKMEGRLFGFGNPATEISKRIAEALTSPKEDPKPPAQTAKTQDETPDAAKDSTLGAH